MAAVRFPKPEVVINFLKYVKMISKAFMQTFRVDPLQVDFIMRPCPYMWPIIT